MQFNAIVPSSSSSRPPPLHSASHSIPMDFIHTKRPSLSSSQFLRALLCFSSKSAGCSTDLARSFRRRRWIVGI